MASLTSIKLLFHSLAWILRTAWSERLWSGHWKSTQRADPRRQSWKGHSELSIVGHGIKAWQFNTISTA